ncbi:hypothetical protein V495_07117, partial [Pseudogymnoascus sp. VKM F-4514 (FW-929)]
MRRLLTHQSHELPILH